MATIDSKEDTSQIMIVGGGGRIQYLDALKGFAILLVVFGHVMMDSFDLGTYKTNIGAFFYSINMPIFFFVSGFLAYKSKENWSQSYVLARVKSKAVQLVPPAIIFFVAYNLFKRNLNPLDSIWGEGWGKYWFTVVLFQFFLMYLLIARIEKVLNRNLLVPALCILSACGILWLSLADRTATVWTNLTNFERVTKYFQFFSLGLICKRYHKDFLKFLEKDWARGVIIAGFFVLFSLTCQTVFKNSYPFFFSLTRDIIIRYLGLITAYILFYQNYKYFEKDFYLTKMLCVMGRRSIDIYLIHFFFIPPLLWLGPYLTPDSMMLCQLFISLFISILIVIVSLTVSEVLRCSHMLATILFGEKNKRKI